MDSKQTTLLEAREIHKKFKQPHGSDSHVLRGVSLTLKAGECVAIMGPSGCGKSTLLHVLGLMETPDAGEIVFLGKSVKRLLGQEKDTIRRENIGFLFQFNSLLEELTLEENFELVVSLKITRPNAKEGELKFMKELARNFQISNLLDRYPKGLSGGELTRANLLKALLGKPKLLLADEPTGNLDHQNAEGILRCLREALDESKKDKQNDMSLMVVTHNPEVARIANITYELYEGKLKEGI